MRSDANEVIINSGRKPNSPALEEILEYGGAKEAFDKLVEVNVPPRLLEYLLCWMAALPTKVLPRSRAIERRKVAGLARKARGLSHEIERDSQSPSRIRGPLTSSSFDLMTRLPELLREFAKAWEAAHPVRPRGLDQRTEAIVCLCHVVKGLTGRYHYGEITPLLNATDAVGGQGEGDPRWDVTNLKQLMHRRAGKPAKSRRVRAR